MKTTFLSALKVIKCPVPRPQAAPLCPWHGGGGLCTTPPPGVQGLSIGWVVNPTPTQPGVGALQSGERLEACPVLPSYNILFNTVCAYQRTMSIHFGG